MLGLAALNFPGIRPCDFSLLGVALVLLRDVLQSPPLSTFCHPQPHAFAEEDPAKKRTITAPKKAAGAASTAAGTGGAAPAAPQKKAAVPKKAEPKAAGGGAVRRYTALILVK